MPVNRNALLRYQTIDRCLRNRLRRWTLEDLIEAVSEALYEYEGSDKGISRRSVQADIQVMRSSQLGYNAPIVVRERKYYAYGDPDYSITKIPLSRQDLDRLSEAVGVLRQFKGFSHFERLGSLVQKLEDHVHAAATESAAIIEFGRNEELRGIDRLDELYSAILHGHCMKLSYRSFKAQKAETFHFHPWWLKEYRNRWYLGGIRGKRQPVMSLALDRIESVDPAPAQRFHPNDRMPAAEYYRDVVGVSVTESSVQTVRFLAEPEAAPYIETKPLHSSQTVVKRGRDGTVFQLKVKLNLELERELLGFGPSVQVLAPAKLRQRISKLLFRALAQYEDG